VVADPSPNARLTVTCRIVDKAWQAPHEIGNAAPERTGTPVILNTGAGPTAAVDVLINLTAQVPAQPQLATRIIEIIDADPARRAAGRARFKAYRDRGFALATHDL
jgi:DNA polymerase III subunit chi